MLGAICPSSGEISTLIFDYCDTETFQIFLNQIAEQTKKRSNKKNIILVLDNASWHKSSKINWHNITPIFLPPYSRTLIQSKGCGSGLKKNSSLTLWLRHLKIFIIEYVKLSDFILILQLL